MQINRIIANCRKFIVVKHRLLITTKYRDLFKAINILDFVSGFGRFTHAEMKKLLTIIWKPEMENIIEGEILKKADKGNYASKEEINETFS